MTAALGWGLLTFALCSVGVGIFFGLISGSRSKESEIEELSKEIIFWSFLLGLAVFLINV